jgi:hypothetical protein
MKRRSSLITVLITLLIVQIGQSQFLINSKGAKGAQTALMQPMLVELHDVDEEVLKDLNEEEKLEYRKSVTSANEIRTAAFRKYWKIGQELIFIERSKAEALLKSKNYTVFGGYRFEPTSAKSINPQSNNTPQSTSDAPTTAKEYGIYLTTSDGGVRNIPEVRVVMSYEIETEMDYKFVLLNLQKYLIAESEGKKYGDASLYDKEKNIVTLQEKTLWFDKDMLDTVKYSFAEALADYKHPGKLKFCTGAEIYKALEEENSSAMFINYLYNESKTLWMYAIIDAATMNVVALQPPNRVHLIFATRTGTDQERNMAKFHGGRYYSSAPQTVWQFRVKLQLRRADFKYLALPATVKMNY